MGHLNEIDGHGLNGVALKVYNAVPIGEEWTASAVLREIARATGSAPEHRVVKGSLEALAEKKLVKKSGYGENAHYSRKPQKVKPEARKDEPSMVVEKGIDPTCPAQLPKQASAPKGDDLLSRFADITDRQRKLATAFAGIARDTTERLEKLSSELADLALEVEARLAEDAESSKTLRQLQELFKSLGAR